MIVDYLSSTFDRVVAKVKEAKPTLKAILYKGPKIKRSQVIRPHVKGCMLKSPMLKNPLILKAQNKFSVRTAKIK